MQKKKLERKAFNLLQKMKMNAKGQLGLDVAFVFVIGLLTLVLLGIAYLTISGALGSSGLNANNPVIANATAGVIGNGSAAVSTLFSSATTWMILIGVVILILIIVLVIRSIRSVRGGGG